MNRSKLRSVVAASLAMTSLWVPKPGLAQQSTALEEVIVTASKREERLLDVPAAIDTLSSGTIERLGIASFDDYAGLIPNLDQRSFGAPGSGTVIIRGLNTGPQQTTNTVGFYLDDTPFTASGAFSVGSTVTPDPDLSDVERIEVLKGPQGTLYGASSLGGLVRIISKRPDLKEFSGSATMSGSSVDDGGSGYGMRASINAPLSQDRVGLRLSGFYRQDPGFVTNIATGSKDVNEATSYGGKFSLLSRLGDNADLLINGLYQKIEADGSSAQDNVTDTLQPLYGKRIFSSYFNSTYEAKYQTLAGTLNWNVGPGTLTSTLAYAEYRTSTLADYTNVYGPLLAGFLPPGTGLKADPGPRMKKSTMEVRYASERIGAFEFLAGAFYTDEKNTYPIALVAENIATGAVLPPPFGNILDTLTHSNYEEYAAFGNLTFYFSDALDLTLGARYAHNDQNVDITRSGLLLGVFVPTTTEFVFDDNATTYLATLRWRLSESLSTFVRAASGYRPGGPQTNVLFPDAKPFDADGVWNYEIGVKGSFPDRRLGFSASAYHIVWDDIQINVLRGGFVFLGNGGKGEVNGFEFEAQLAPTDHLSLGLSVGYNDTKLVDIDAEASASLGAVKGDAFPLSPKWGGAFTIDYRVPLMVDWVGTLGASWKYTGERPSSFSAAATNPNIDLPSYSTVDLRAGLERGPWKLALRVDNVTNEAGLASFSSDKIFAGQITPSSAVLIRPRTYGLSLSVDF